MESFDNIEQLWGSQKTAEPTVTANEIESKAKVNSFKIKRNHQWTVGVIATTFIILVVYFFWMSAHQFNELTLGLSLMIAMLVLRIVLEWKSLAQFNAIDPNLPTRNYIEEVKQFYSRRKFIHYVLTPVIFVTYIIGFVLLLPIFKQNLSAGFYLYILISGPVIFIVLALFIAKKIQAEMRLLTKMKRFEF
jgi:hypothetical protein